MKNSGKKLKEMLLEEHSKAQMLKIAAFIGEDSEKFQELMNLFFQDEYRVVQRAAWPINEIAERHPQLMQPYIEKMILYLKTSNLHDAVIRNTMRILQYQPLPEFIHGELITIGFNYLEKPKVPVAIKIFTMRTLLKLMKLYPELKEEFSYLISHPIPWQTSGYKSCAKKILEKLGS